MIQRQPDPRCILLSRHPRGQPGEFPGGSVVKIRLPRQETRVPSLGQKDPLEEEMATHSRYGLGHPMDRGAWWNRVCGVTKSQTQLSD